MTRVLFGALAAVDLILAGYLALLYDWFTVETHVNHDNVGAVIAIPIAWAFMAAEKFFFAMFFAGIFALIYRELTGRSKNKNWATRLSSLIFVVALLGIGTVWIYGAARVLYGPPGFLIDRLLAFDSFTESTNDFFDLFGTQAYLSGSVGRYLILLLGAAYLAEKYLMAGWNVRWPIPILPIAAVAWVLFTIHDGETRLKAWVAAQQWAPVNDQLPWLDAVGACEQMGDGWRLPHREELARYFSMQPPPTTGDSYAWTSTMTDGGLWAIGVDRKPRRSGRWNKGSELTRDESLCELRDARGYGYASGDWFTAYRQQVCDKTTMSAYLYTPGLKPVLLQNSNVAQQYPAASAICIKPSGENKIPNRARRGYDNENDYTRVRDFKAAMKAQCDKTPDRSGGACYAFAPDLPDFEESGDEKLMRAFCELARNGEGCDRYAMFMDKHPGAEERAARYRARGCTLGYAPACGGGAFLRPVK